MKFDVKIKGIAPMLMHRFNEDKITGIRKQSGADKSMDEKAKIEAASKFLFVNSKGKLMAPAVHIEGAMIRSASELRLAGAGKKTYKDLLKAALFVSPEQIIHKNQKWEVDGRPVVNPTTRGRSMCYRPRLEEWELEFQVEVLDDRADPNAIHEILKLAGLRQGIGSYRPRFGRFEVLSFKEVKSKK